MRMKRLYFAPWQLSTTTVTFVYKLGSHRAGLAEFDNSELRHGFEGD